MNTNIRNPWLQIILWPHISPTIQSVSIFVVSRHIWLVYTFLFVFIGKAETVSYPHPQAFSCFPKLSHMNMLSAVATLFHLVKGDFYTCINIIRWLWVDLIKWRIIWIGPFESREPLKSSKYFSTCSRKGNKKGFMHENFTCYRWPWKWRGW